MCGISLEIVILLKVSNIEILKMVLFHWLEAKKILNEELPANTQPRRQGPPLLYNSLLEPFVASNCKGTTKSLAEFHSGAAAAPPPRRAAAPRGNEIRASEDPRAI